MNTLELGFAFLLSQTTLSIMSVFWYTLIFEFPRYILPFLVAGMAMRSPDAEALIEEDGTASEHPSVSVILVGHNEEDALEACSLYRTLRSSSSATVLPTAWSRLPNPSSNRDWQRKCYPPVCAAASPAASIWHAPTLRAIS